MANAQHHHTCCSQTKHPHTDLSHTSRSLTQAHTQGELSPTAVNAPMVPREVLLELQPFVSLAEGLGRAAVQLVGETGFSDITIEYASPRGDDLDSRLLRAMVIKGVLEQITTSTVNIVNADLLAKNRGLTIKEVNVPADGRDVLSYMQVSVKTSSSKFSSALDRSAIKVPPCVHGFGMGG